MFAPRRAFQICGHPLFLPFKQLQSIFLRLSSSASTSSFPNNKETKLDVESLTCCHLEFKSGCGGLEAALFVSELIQLHQNYAEYNGWSWHLFGISSDFSKSRVGGGIRSAFMHVEGDLCYSKLRFEGGVHMVKRLPVTNSKGKGVLHTSTASVAVLPQPAQPESMFSQNEIKEELMRSPGPGGSNVGGKDTCIRVTHLPTGISVKVSDERHLEQNKKLAYERLSAILLKQQVDEIAQRSSSFRKLQVGTLKRAERIRTYQFKDDRIYEHRLNRTIPGIHEFMEGGTKYAEVIDDLVEMYELEELEWEQQVAIEEKMRREREELR